VGNGSWMIVYETPEAEALMTNLCAQGYPDEEVARMMRESGLVEQMNEEFVQKFRKHSARAITQYSEAAAKDLFSKIPRSKKAYRVGELDKLLDVMATGVRAYIGDKPLWAARLMTVFMQGQKMIADEVGDYSGGEIENRWVQLLNEGDMEQKKALTSKLLELEEIAKEIQSKKSREKGGIVSVDVEAIDGEFEVEDEG
jgi:hypothetical protein